ncbi:hypothetical protein MHBO_003578 [Bonamia ostreae]|uniref:Uncharacterized protein n=1 Tax=Bonamia ostreae TaxID=126728 RepID=A0ABV2AQV7_9EUKA
MLILSKWRTIFRQNKLLQINFKTRLLISSISNNPVLIEKRKSKNKKSVVNENNSIEKITEILENFANCKNLEKKNIKQLLFIKNSLNKLSEKNFAKLLSIIEANFALFSQNSEWVKIITILISNSEYDGFKEFWGELLAKNYNTIFKSKEFLWMNWYLEYIDKAKYPTFYMKIKENEFLLTSKLSETIKFCSEYAICAYNHNDLEFENFVQKNFVEICNNAQSFKIISVFNFSRKL